MQKKILWPLSFLLVLLVGVILGTCVFGIYFEKLNYQAYKENYASQNTGQTKNASENKNSETEIVSTTESAWNKLWSIYTSPQGISFKYPKQISVIDRCGGGHDPYVEMKVLEDKSKNTIYVAPDYYYDYPATADGSEDTTKPCQKVVNSLAQINGEGVPQTAFYSTGNILGGLNINVRDVKNKDELDKFIKDIYGPGCKIKDKGVYKDAEGHVTPLDEMGGNNEIKLNTGEDAQGNMTGLDETVCPVNYIYKIMYSKEKNKAIAMSLGQDCTISNINDVSSPEYECYIFEIADSIKFN